MTETINFNRGGIIMKKTITTLACCALIAPLASAQTRSTQTRETIPNEEGVTVTGTIMTTTEEGAAANYQPPKTLVVLEDRSNTPGNYVLNGPGHIVDKHGDVITTAIKPGNTRACLLFKPGKCAGG